MKKYLIALVCFLLHSLVSAQSDKLSYSFQLNDQKDGINVTMTYHQYNKDTFAFLIPSNYDNMSLKNTVLVNDIELISEGKLIEIEGGKYRYEGNETKIILLYSIPLFSNNYEYLSCEGSLYFQPAITNAFFHMYGDMSLILPEFKSDKNALFDIEIEWKGFPKDWHMANDFGISNYNKGKRLKQFREKLTISDIGQTLFFGGNYRKFKFSNAGVNFHTYIYGDFQFSDESLIANIKSMTNSQMEFWKHFHHSKEYVISITQKGKDCGKITGRNMLDSYSFYMSGNFTEKELPVIFGKGLTHEFTHSWIGMNLIGNNPEWKETLWFVEGFTEYYAQLVNLKANIINKKQYVSILNNSIVDYLLSPYANTTLEEFTAKYDFSDKFRQLAYDKGAVFAFYLDGYIREKSKNKFNLKDYVIALVDSSKERINGNLDIKLMCDIAKEYVKVDISHLIEKYIVQGEIIPIESPFIESLRFKEMVSFDYGFDFLTSMDKEVIVGLKPNSNAYKQGLRNGQKLKAIKAITDKVNGTIGLDVIDKDKVISILFKPQGKTIKVPLINKLKTK